MSEDAKNQKIWGGASDPAAHDPQKFRYLVYALNPFASSSMALFNADLARSRMEAGEDWQPDPSHGDQTISLFKEPERVAERISLSMSLIDQDHTETWGDGGLIVEVPEENILGTGGSDLGSFNSDLSHLKSRFSKEEKYTGDALLARTSPNIYNEVVAIANLDGRKIQLRGFFYKINSRGEAVNEVIAQQMENHALRLGLPIVKIRTPSAYPKDEIIRENGRLAVHLGGWRYLISGFGEQDFKVTEGKEVSSIAPGDMKLVLHYMARQGVEYDELAVIEAAYLKADEERQRARVVFDESGNVSTVFKTSGYSRDQVRYEVVASGYARLVNEKKQMERLNRSMLGDVRAGFDSRGVYSPLTQYEVEQLVAEARVGLEPEQDAKVAAWLEAILPDVESKSRMTYGDPMQMYERPGSSPGFQIICKNSFDFSKTISSDKFRALKLF